MALEYRYQPRDAGAPVDTVKVDRHWYLTEDKTRVVPEGHSEGRSLWATPGMDVPRADAERLGAVEVQAAEPEPTAPADEPAAAEPGEGAGKEQAPPPNKQKAKPGDKASKPDTVAVLRKQAADLGVQVDNRWGVDRLHREIAAAQGGEG